jgi:hypothetical protein
MKNSFCLGSVSAVSTIKAIELGYRQYQAKKHRLIRLVECPLLVYLY